MPCLLEFSLEIKLVDKIRLLAIWKKPLSHRLFAFSSLLAISLNDSMLASRKFDMK